MRGPLLALGMLGCAVAVIAAPPEGTLGVAGKRAEDSCVGCHLELDDPRLTPPATQASDDVHRTQGVTCAGCHGGDPTAADPDEAMAPSRGFRGRFSPQEIPGLCGSCHADPTFMLAYAPNIPTDQLAQYRTSRHGKALAGGDTKVAVCTSCHGAHGVLPPSDARSPVYPTRVVETCAHCHGNPSLMQQYGISGQEPAEYETSVHSAALVEKNDLSAPTCNDCHGSHGATPPGVSSVSNVCGSCHVTQRELFDASPHKDAFAAMEQPACETCHSNHAVHHPSDELIGLGEGQICGECHSPGDEGAAAAGAIHQALTTAAEAITSARGRVGQVERAGMLMDDAEVQLQDAHESLVLARNQVHTLDAGQVGAQTLAALTATTRAQDLAAAAESELRYRRTGLFMSLFVILVALLALILKIRSMEAA